MIIVIISDKDMLKHQCGFRQAHSTQKIEKLKKIFDDSAIF